MNDAEIAIVRGVGATRAEQWVGRVLRDVADRSDDAMTPAVGTKNFSQSCCTSQRCSHTHSTRAAARAGQLWRALETHEWLTLDLGLQLLSCEVK